MHWRELPRVERPLGGEVEMLLYALDRARQQFGWKTGGLGAEELRRTHAPSTMTLAGLVKHLAFVEDGFTARAAGEPIGPPWDVRGWVENDRWGWESALTDAPDELYGLWYTAVERSRGRLVGA
ncbi:DUF664 domain-containing protein [Kribbella sp. NPDC004536]|uniref:mycothiol transferase n=1 Tax=Kribbella sp. NPDC004536 TaxID=3364106 RepID=UPI0036B00EDD